MSAKRNTIDMSHGPLTAKLIRYAAPLALTYLLQLAFVAADMVVIGQWGSPESLAAIGATTPLLGLLLNVMTGISTGSNVLAAQYYGAKDSKRMTRMVHTTVAVSVIGGIAVALLGWSTLHWLVRVTGIPEASREQSMLYLAICFVGVPFQIIYNFACAILRAVGDTKAPLYFLCIAGTINIVLNLILVVFVNMDVAGVALATVISQCLSAFLALRRLQNAHGATRLRYKNLRVEKSSFKGILKIGIPAGLQSGCFSLSNIVVQSGINTFGVNAVAGMTAGFHLEMLLYALVFALHHTTIAAVGQNYGAQQYRRLIKAIHICMILSLGINLICGVGMSALSPWMIRIFSGNAEVIRFGVMRAHLMFTVYFLIAFMDTSSGALRGLGNSLLPAVSTLVGTCFLRILWMKYIFPVYGTMESILLVYPASWAVVAALNMTVLFISCKKLLKTADERQLQPHHGI
ncbi:MAG: MATE family efflux transporter [Lentisphaerae bacterium]|nr:MATE family efflux transporter [Lentisphaerota bacterium]